MQILQERERVRGYEANLQEFVFRKRINFAWPDCYPTFVWVDFYIYPPLLAISANCISEKVIS